MTAPAEDPRVGEAVCSYGHTKAGHDALGACARPAIDDPERQAHYFAARPAGDRAQPTEELREAIAEASHIGRATAMARGVKGDWNIHIAVADEILALPAVAALLDAQAAVERVEALCEDGGHEGWVSTRAVRRALDGA